MNSAVVVLGQEIHYPDWFEASRDYVEIGIATGILGTIAYHEGPMKIGFTGAASLNVRQSLHGIFVILGLGFVAYGSFLLAIMSAVTRGILPVNNFVLGFPNEPPDVLQQILWSIHAGWVEEIIVVGLTFFLLKRAPWQIGGKPIWMTGWATAISIAIRLSYHTYHGLMVIPMILTGWLFVRLYRTTGTIIPLIIVHVTWNVVDLITHTGWQRIIFLVSVYVLAELLTKGTGDFAGLGFPNFPYRDDRWRGYYWARWRWEKNPEFLLPKSQGKRKPEHVGIHTVDG
jgi:hypothetical protein